VAKQDPGRCLGQRLKCAYESHPIRSDAYRWRIHNIRNDFTLQQIQLLIFRCQSLLRSSLGKFLRWKFGGDSWRPHKERIVLSGGEHLWRRPPGQFPCRVGILGTQPFPSISPALTQITVKLMICFNPTKIRASNLNSFKEKSSLTSDLGYFSSNI
jgi:hypothetical protein